jgi:hypothetical protein
MDFHATQEEKGKLEKAEKLRVVMVIAGKEGDQSAFAEITDQSDIKSTTLEEEDLCSHAISPGIRLYGLLWRRRQG